MNLSFDLHKMTTKANTKPWHRSQDKFFVLVALNNVTNNVFTKEGRVLRSQYSQYINSIYPLKMKHSIY